MSLTHQSTASKALCLSSYNSRSSAITNQHRISGSRSFWGRHGYGQKCSSNLRYGPSSCKTQQLGGSRQSPRAKASSLDEIKRDPIYQYSVTQGWRLLSSWGKSTPSSSSPRWESSPADAEGRESALSATDTRARRERLQRRIEQDPFAILFGGRAAERAWYPWYWSAGSFQTSQKPNPSQSTDNKLIQESLSESFNASSRGAIGGDKGPSASTHNTELEEYVYDPISMRKIPKSSRQVASAPLEKHAINKMPTIKSRLTTNGSSAPDDTQASSTMTSKAVKKVESSMDRHVRKFNSPCNSSAEPKVSNPQTTKTGEHPENLESLRPRDIRAAFERLRKDFVEKEKALQEQTDKRRQSMQQAFEKRMEEIEIEFTKESSKSRSNSQLSSAATPETSKASQQDEQDAILRLTREEERKAGALAAEIRKKQDANAKLDSEIDAHKAAMDAHESQRSKVSGSDHGSSLVPLGEGDMSAQVLQYTKSERWYKNQAPHALAKKRSVIAEQEGRKARDRELVREIRDIYESAYGIIDTKHQQGPISVPQQDKVYEDGSSNYVSPQVVSPHLQFSGSPLPSAGCSEGDKVKPEGDLIPPPPVTTTRRPAYMPVKAHPLFESCLKLAWALETNLWAILACMHHFYLNSLQIDRARASRLLARLVDNDGKIQADMQALAISDLDLRCLKAWHRQLHSRMDPEKFSSKRKILSDILGLPGKQILDKGPMPSPREGMGRNTPVKSERQLYKILALNFDTHAVTTATTSSSLYESSRPPKSAASILSHLSHPASFIPHIEALQHTNFELVAGSRSMLVYKEISFETPSSSHGKQEISGPRYESPSSSNQSEQTRPTEGILDNGTKVSQSREAPNQKSSPQSCGSSIRITVNSPSGGTVKIPSISVSGSEQALTDYTSASGGPQTSTPTKSLDHIDTKPPSSSHVSEKPLSEVTLLDDPEPAQSNDKILREGAGSPRRRRRGFWKRFKRFVARSFILGGLCYFAGSFSVWYQKRKEALEREEKGRENPLTFRKW